MRKLAPESTRSIVRDAFIVSVISAAAALAVNAVRAAPFPLVADAPYQILVPCPDLKGHADGISAADVDLSMSGTVVVDARDVDAYATWHVEGARSLPYDWLEPPPKDQLAELIALGGTRVVVYGDGADPDSGAELAKELAGSGLRNVVYVIGGAPALGAPAPTDQAVTP
ncbi:MAG: hypothetical protein CSA66_05650 [Proteobacteria bacterium]|nr:MAG: hypothetical protein CSA66_05650 [Pseudomonadota bacterium]